MDLLDYEGLLRYDELIKKDIAKKINGPSSSTDAHIVVFDGTTGKTVKDSGFTIGKSVPSNAVFTDTNTKVTSASNHYTPSADANSELTASISGTAGTFATNTEYTVLTGVKALRDGKGHVTGLTYTALKIKDTTVANTDRYVNSASFADNTSSDANNPVKMTLTRAGSDSATVTGTLPKVSSSSAGVVPKGTSVSSQSQSTKFLREDGSWATPSYTTNTNTTYKLTVNGTANGGGSTSLGTIYAPTTAGTSGQILTSSGSGAPTWGTAPAAATIKYTTIDSNVTDINANAATQIATLTANALLKTSLNFTSAEKTQVLTNLGIASARNITVSTSDPTSSDGNDGDIWFVYES